jgi:hypothetical protein
VKPIFNLDRVRSRSARMWAQSASAQAAASTSEVAPPRPVFGQIPQEYPSYSLRVLALPPLLVEIAAR